MKNIDQISKLILSSAALVLAASAFVYSVRGVDTAHAVATEQKSLPTSGAVYTQSANGEKLIVWEYEKKSREWKRTTFSKSFK